MYRLIKIVIRKKSFFFFYSFIQYGINNLLSGGMVSKSSNLISFSVHSHLSISFNRVYINRQANNQLVSSVRTVRIRQTTTDRDLFLLFYLFIIIISFSIEKFLNSNANYVYFSLYVACLQVFLFFFCFFMKFSSFFLYFSLWQFYNGQQKLLQHRTNAGYYWCYYNIGVCIHYYYRYLVSVCASLSIYVDDRLNFPCSYMYNIDIFFSA